MGLKDSIIKASTIEVSIKPVSVNITIVSELSVGDKNQMIESTPITVCYDDFMKLINSDKVTDVKVEKSSFEKRMEKLCKERGGDRYGV
ncbi:hypothetical protein ORI89_07535 [Sphingobacterium sp. UT-1RO-CII-1]|uniref:hypothetical protein n=1 Tax=Sphingobacterium sp. UT-1RO-CII-1 TaxID=2995225 RepID=UPI00227C663E|nr:hypothetical protein [Sphingobacterium sp. UT-1RO-CII-1]MCY4779497.1 hypothetical protein [Sphingobacterium sp. UT-1RO-CII-1]